MTESDTQLASPKPLYTGKASLRDVDWEAVKASYLQGTPLAQLASEHNLHVHQIRNRAWRQNWRMESLPDASTQSASHQQLIQEWQENMALCLLARSRWYADHLEPGTLRDNRDLESAVQSHIAAGRMLFGLDKEDKGRSPWQGMNGNVIDVTSTTTVATLKPNDKQS